MEGSQEGPGLPVVLQAKGRRGGAGPWPEYRGWGPAAVLRGLSWRTLYLLGTVPGWEWTPAAAPDAGVAQAKPFMLILGTNP